MERSTEHGVNSAWAARLTTLKGRPAAHVTTCGAAQQFPIRMSCTATHPAELHDRTAKQPPGTRGHAIALGATRKTDWKIGNEGMRMANKGSRRRGGPELPSSRLDKMDDEKAPIQGMTGCPMRHTEWRCGGRVQVV